MTRAKTKAGCSSVPLDPPVGRRDAWPGRWYESAAHKVGLYLYCVLPFGQWLRWRWARWLHWTVMRPAGTALMAWATRRSQATDTPPNVEHDRRTAVLSPGVRVDGPVGPHSGDGG